jgi:anti-sigma regulatory factor (Ser/Thr protein kinase)
VTQLSFVVPPAAQSAPGARTQLRTVLGTWADEQTRDDAALLLTELVANAVIHARTSMKITLTVDQYLLRAEVRDASPFAPLHREADEYGGRGVLILNALASNWGVVGHPGEGKTVWFELTSSSVGAALVLV